MQQLHVSLHRRILNSHTDGPSRFYEVLPRDSNEDRVTFFNAAFAAHGTIVRSLEPSEGYESLMVALFLFTGEFTIRHSFRTSTDLDDADTKICSKRNSLRTSLEVFWERSRGCSIKQATWLRMSGALGNWCTVFCLAS